MVFANLNIISLSIFILLLFFGYFLIFMIIWQSIFSKVLIFLSFFLIIFCIFEPKLGFYKDQGKFVGTNYSFVLDVSKSMNSLDFNSFENNISRLNSSKDIVNSFIGNNIENKFALSIFSLEGLSILPFTDDIDMYKTVLSGIDEKNISKNGSNIIGAIKTGIDNFTSDYKSGVLVLFTDGGDYITDIRQTDELLNISKILKSKKISLVIIGVGSLNGAYIPTGIDQFGNQTYKIYNGKRVITKLNEKNLIQISDILGGKYYKYDDILKKISLENSLSNIGEKVVFYREIEKKLDLTRFFVIVSFLFFVIGLWLKK